MMQCEPEDLENSCNICTSKVILGKTLSRLKSLLVYYVQDGFITATGMLIGISCVLVCDW